MFTIPNLEPTLVGGLLCSSLLAVQACEVDAIEGANEPMEALEDAPTDGEILTADWARLPSAHLSEELLPPLEPEPKPAPDWSKDYAAEPGPDQTHGTLSCSQDNDCRVSSCYCGPGGTCELRLIGPFPPEGAAYCDLPPTRACSSASDCRNGCSCMGGVCGGAISPQPPDCHLPPPDSYEYDDVYTSWSAYTGPQTHSFHDSGDADWVAVYIHDPGLVRFRTHNLKYQADTKIKVFTFDNLVKGALLGVSDDVGGPWFWPDSQSSRVDIEVPAQSTYLIKIVNLSPASVYTDSLAFPEYTLTLSYL